ncbi:hypothetical protein K466DRAFT_591980 [Polyporus arcularius HHB13444]|uniref:Uncharacterized protein n=1 Tax=Polyporus arcularius HHB13444 TaxID=1314778 RepID=A0A5C3NSI4_9APHY|nr:hypothetical protein K466DRAFT_591980 [Polyporus arcularius HHB13444]
MRPSLRLPTSAQLAGSLAEQLRAQETRWIVALTSFRPQRRSVQHRDADCLDMICTHEHGTLTDPDCRLNGPTLFIIRFVTVLRGMLLHDTCILPS